MPHLCALPVLAEVEAYHVNRDHLDPLHFQARGHRFAQDGVGTEAQAARDRLLKLYKSSHDRQLRLQLPRDGFGKYVYDQFSL